MREILFRGKRIDNGEWVCSGNLIHFNENNEYYIPVANSKCVCTHDENDNIIEWNETLFCKVIPETVGQYTGLTDKNGKKIFEGDIISSSSCNGMAISVVKYGEFEPKMFYDLMERCVFKERPKEKMYGLFAKTTKEEMLLTNCPHLIKVIGNIHDNPELLKGGEK